MTPERVVDLGRRLRGEGVACALSESTTAVAALTHLDAEDVEDVRAGLRAAFCSSAADLEVFERCFPAWWRGARPSSAVENLLSKAASGRGDRPTPGAPSGPDGLAAAREDLVEQATDEGDARERPIGAVYSAAHSLARRSFASIGDEELREVDVWLERLMVRLSTRRSRRLEPGGRRGPIDVRRTLRSLVAHEGELVRLARRRRRHVPPQLVVLCDVSGSMERYSRFLLRFLLGCGRARDIQTFAFSTRLTHLTPWLAGEEIDPALDRLRARGWSSGTRIGECLEAFVTLHGQRMLGRRTLVIILSDGLDQGEVEPLRRAMGWIQRRARRVIWLNPLLESSRYAPEARGMRTALPYVDYFQSGHSLEALRTLPGLLRL
ncbi:MAG: VWA domain-containing protein [Gemmatimonadota bacterium]|uniref:vWA domain-containing protein n=1 Tax=Candidatus Palauibacter scopulicola TaxID=3056741 RepID=UPI002394623A|nr:VWA domain-containing protein [Candidatus Palauibacter scopulicola]MDE2661535.1 VWA domain-containing protein [Candidatus Palauibacter scopulicola]